MKRDPDGGVSEAGCAEHEIKHMQSFKKDDAASITEMKLKGKR